MHTVSNLISARFFSIGIPHCKRPKVLELDVHDMFPRLPREGVREAVTEVSEELTRFLRDSRVSPNSCLPDSLRVGTKDIVFTIHKRHKRLHKLRRRYASRFHVLHFVTGPEP